MKYAEIDVKTARKCCKQHSYKNKAGYTIPKCETCPLERKNTEGKKGFCWFVLKSLYDENEKKESLDQCDILVAEYNALMQEDVSKQLEWDKWIESQQTVE